MAERAGGYEKGHAICPCGQRHAAVSFTDDPQGEGVASYSPALDDEALAEHAKDFILATLDH